MSVFFKHREVYLSGLMILILLALAHNLWECHSRYLYFSTEIGLILLSAMVYRKAFEGKKWSDPPEPNEKRPALIVDRVTILTWSFGILALILAVYWISLAVFKGLGFIEIIQRGSWFLFWLIVFKITTYLVRDAIRFINLRALVMTSILMTYLLTTYENILLYNGQGWEYNNTILAWVLKAPLGSILFVYPVAPALAILLYVRCTNNRQDMFLFGRFFKNLNNLKAFWLLNLLLAPASIFTEYLGIHVFKLWTIFNDSSVWPMGWTNLEEILYYIIAQFLSIALYVLLDKGFSNENS